MEPICVGQLLLSLRPGGSGMEAEARRYPNSQQGSVIFRGLHLVKAFCGNTISQGILAFLYLWAEWVQVTQEWSRSIMDIKDSEP